MESARIPGKIGSKEKKSFFCKSQNCPLFVNELAEFELDLLTMVHNIEFRPVRNIFLLNLKDDVKIINSTKKVLVNADKSTSTYK